MNSKFNEEQIKAYAGAFEEGDAIYCNGEWHQVVEIERDKEEGWTARLTACVDGNNKIISFGTGRGVVLEGFLHDLVTNPYRVTTLEHYKLQSGEKIVWLGKSSEVFTFGSSYEVTKGFEGTSVIFDNYGTEHTPIHKELWGIIPKYSQVKDNSTEPKKQTDHSINIQTPQEVTYNDILSQFESRIHNITDSLYYEIANNGKHKAKMLFESILQNGYDNIIAQIQQDTAQLTEIVSSDSKTEYAQLYKITNQLQQVLESLILLDAVVEEKIQLHEQGE